jgi:hypothetical protein
MVLSHKDIYLRQIMQDNRLILFFRRYSYQMAAGSKCIRPCGIFFAGHSGSSSGMPSGRDDMCITGGGSFRQECPVGTQRRSMSCVT